MLSIVLSLTAIYYTVLIINYKIYKMVGKEKFVKYETGPLAKLLVARIGGWAFLVMALLVPPLFTILLLFDDLILGMLVGVIIVMFINDFRAYLYLKKQAEMKRKLKEVMIY